MSLSFVWHLIHWRSVIEILFFSALFYNFSFWLRKDRSKNLLASFYGYCVLAFIAYALEIGTITHFLFLSAPVALMIFVLVHQETLQRNFILMRNITPAKASDEDWLNMLISSLLTAASHNKQVICVIEKSDSLQSLLASPLHIQAAIQKDLLDILLSSSSFDEQKLIWMNHQGQLLGINATWHALLDEVWISDDVQTLETWKQDALLLTNKTDALVFKISPATRSFDLIAQKKIIENCNTAEAVSIIKRYIQGKNYLDQLPTDKNLVKGDYAHLQSKHTRDQSFS